MGVGQVIVKPHQQYLYRYNGQLCLYEQKDRRKNTSTWQEVHIGLEGKCNYTRKMWKRRGPGKRGRGKLIKIKKGYLSKKEREFYLSQNYRTYGE